MMQKIPWICFAIFSLMITDAAADCDYVAANVDFLYWYPSANKGLIIAEYQIVDVTSEGQILTDVFFVNSAKFVRGDHHPGVRVGLEFAFPCFCWKFGLDWTYLNFSQKHTPKLDANEINPSFVPFSIRETSPFSTAEAVGPNTSHWDLTHHTLDFGVTRQVCCFGNAFVLTPGFSFRYHNIDSNQTIKQRGELLSTSNSELVARYIARFITLHDEWGVGPRIEMGLDWNLCDCLGIDAGFAIAMLYGKDKASVSTPAERVDVVDPINEGSEFCVTVFNEEISCNYFSSDISLGAYYQGCIRGSITTVIRVAWEHRLYHHFYGSRDNLSFQGLTLSLQVGY